ncbi:hypothetical protein ACFUJU_07755 [Streptomyces sp. NPDC057235]|uniref:hypothetical protein n=1 Tax=Streptomyces sp. NPDC057235 TaxID=3346058 RepID=UPI0036316289
MSYRHSSYRKVSRIVRKAASVSSDDAAKPPRHEMDRILHWWWQPALPKPIAWGKPKGWRL